MKFRIGILVIGSLYWDLTPNRTIWQTERLCLDQAFSVPLQICYGRVSESRGNTYTMVFSLQAKSGIAKVVPCKNSVSTVDEIVTEGEWLWAAEKNLTVAELEGELCAGWGSTVIMANPHNHDLAEILTGWQVQLLQQQHYDGSLYTDPTLEEVSAGGQLLLPWPKLECEQSLDSFDILLATANRPTLTGTPPRIPSAQQIAQAYVNAPRSYLNYFINNRTNGIQTFQDDAVIQCLMASGVGLDPA